MDPVHIGKFHQVQEHLEFFKMETINFYNKLVQSLRLVASSFDIQIASLPKFVNVADEIALIYHESYLTLPQLKEKKVISKKILDMLKELDDIFEIMSESKFLWTVDSMKTEEIWQESRELAHDVLRELNESYDIPNLDFIKWIE